MKGIKGLRRGDGGALSLQESVREGMEGIGGREQYASCGRERGKVREMERL